MAQSDECPRENISRNIPKHIYRENVAAALAASECGTAKLERMMMLMNDDLRPAPLPLRNMSFLTKTSQVTGTHRYLLGTNVVGPNN